MDRIGAALRLLTPVDHAACEKLLRRAVRFVDLNKYKTHFARDIGLKSARKALLAYRRALCRACCAEKALAANLRFSLKAVRTPTPDYRALIAMCDEFLKNGGGHRDESKLVAAVWAKEILDQLGRKATCTQGGTWATLAAILH